MRVLCWWKSWLWVLSVQHRLSSHLFSSGRISGALNVSTPDWNVSLEHPTIRLRVNYFRISQYRHQNNNNHMTGQNCSAQHFPFSNLGTTHWVQCAMDGSGVGNKMKSNESFPYKYTILLTLCCLKWWDEMSWRVSVEIVFNQRLSVENNKSVTLTVVKIPLLGIYWQCAKSLYVVVKCQNYKAWNT